MVTSRFARAFGGAALMTTVWANGTQAGTCTLPAWGAGNPVGTDVYGNAVTNGGGFIYSAGGSSFSAQTIVNQFRRYDPATNTWTTLANVPTPVTAATLAYDAAGGRLFLFGGLDEITIFDLAQVYAISTNNWSIGPPMPAVRAVMGSGVIGGLIYLVGGTSSEGGGTFETQNWQFNPALGTYTPRAMLPSGLTSPGSAVSGGRLYVMGGRDATTNTLNTNYEYDPVGNVWATRASLPTAVNAPGSAALSGDASCQGDIVVVGGGNPVLGGEAFPRHLSRAGDTTGISQLYNVASNSWSSGPTLPQGRSFLAAAQAGNTLITVGGFNGATSVATVDRIQGPPLPVDLHGFRVE